ncbi:MAG: MarR family transcriptional regulator [Bacteroidales bacterium]|nr:MarR family transcriptional regulator [Clostridium sp.]MCM1202875.1 MarR family transcriptional regulator [Bacteroidales bacterium]
MDDLTEEFFRVIHRFHCSRMKFKGNGELSNVEFLLLLGLYLALDVKNGSLETEEKGITLGEIICSADMSMSAASKKVSILEKKGLVKRTPSKIDRRNVYITLTEKGRELCTKETEKKRIWLEELIERVGREDMKHLLDTANRMFDVINEMDKEQ